MLDAGLKPLRKLRIQGDSFASILERDLGPTISHSFYFPYVRKLWGIAPDELATTLAKRRVSGNSISKIIGKIVRRVSGLSKQSSGGFYYPRKGFGAISTALHREAARHGANFVFGADVSGILHDGKRVKAVRYRQGDVGHTMPANAIWSSLPISLVIKRMDPPAPKEIIEFANRIRFRGMILIYLVLQQRQFSPYDAHYFPELTIPISRMSEPKNYSATSDPADRTVLCAELPCDPGEPYWLLSDEELGRETLRVAGADEFARESSRCSHRNATPQFRISYLRERLRGMVWRNGRVAIDDRSPPDIRASRFVRARQHASRHSDGTRRR